RSACSRRAGGHTGRFRAAPGAWSGGFSALRRPPGGCRGCWKTPRPFFSTNTPPPPPHAPPYRKAPTPRTPTGTPPASSRAPPGPSCGIAPLPMQAPELAAKELKRAMATLGLRGAQIGSNVNGRNLDDPALEPLWEAANALRALIMVHPTGVAGADRLKSYY